MFFSKQINALIKSYKDGTLYIKNYLQLVDGGSKEVVLHHQDYQYDRSLQPSYNYDGFVKEVDILKHPMRRITACLAEGTIFGSQQEMRDAGRSHSIYGLNRECLGKEGLPNMTLLTKYLREIAPSVEIKEQRINLYENVLLAHDFYDNATALVMNILIKIQKVRMADRMEVYPHRLKLSAASVRDVFKIQQNDAMIRALIKAIQSGPTACGTTENDDGLYDILEVLRTWYNTNKDKMTDQSYFEMDVQVWKSYTYDDGHSKSGDNFADVFGFKKNRFLVPKGLNTASSPGSPLSVGIKSEVPSTDSAINNLKKYRYWLNCTNLTQKELMIVEWLLAGNRRQTPFLIDQDVDFGIGDGEVALIGGDLKNSSDVTFNDEELKILLHKMVTVHRWHEDAIAAVRLLRPWYAQPATETLESHWWMYIKRTGRYPTLGLKRASIGILLQGKAVCTSIEAIGNYDKMLLSNDYCVVESMIYNTAWYWGEYLTIMNGKNTHQIMKNMDMNYYDDLDPSIRADALVSAVLGEEIDTCPYPQAYTSVAGGLSQYYSVHVPFGRISIDTIEEYGYEQRVHSIKIKHLVAPGGTALITGRAGSLLRGTPHSSEFIINPMVERHRRNKICKAMNYTDLWAYGIVCRWNGHDVHYSHPLKNGRHRSYCANNVNIAMPPVSPYTLDEVSSYIVNRVEEREMSWGSDFSLRTDREQLFLWLHHKTEILEEPNWRADVVSYDTVHYSVPTSYQETSDLVKDTILRLSTKFDLVSPGFHVERMTAGVTLLNRTPSTALGQPLEAQPVQEEVSQDTGQQQE